MEYQKEEMFVEVMEKNRTVVEEFLKEEGASA